MTNVYLLTLPNQSFASGVLGARDLMSLDPRRLAGADARLRDARPAFRPALVGPQRTVETTFGPALEMDRLLEETGTADVVYVSPLALPPEQVPDYDEGVLAWLRAQHAGGAILCAACTATLPLAASGLLEGVPATTHWAYEQVFRERYPGVDLDARRTLIVGGDDGRLVTSGAHASWYDLMLYLIHRFAGAAAARCIAKFFLIDWHELDQNAYASFRDNRRHSDTVVRQAQQWLRENLSHPQAVDAVIATTGLAARSFHRRFRQATGHTPIRYVQNLRVEHAKELLESSELGIEAVAWQVGYEDAAYFRRLFRRTTGLTPNAYRHAFRTPARIEAQLPPAQPPS